MKKHNKYGRKRIIILDPARIFPVIILASFIFIAGLALAQKNIFAETLEVTAAFHRSFPPAYSVDKEGRPDGFAADLMEHIASLAGLKVNYLIKDTWMEMHNAVKDGHAVLIPDLGITPKRKKKYDFTIQ